jgi:small subunit ribosomal protein S2
MGIDIGESENPMAEELPANDTAVAAYEGEQFERLAAPRGAPDDLTKLNGVGPQLEKKLNEAGIFHYWQLAAMQPGDTAQLDKDLKLNGRLERDGWINQARSMIEAAAA